MFFRPFSSRKSLLNHLSLIWVKTTASLKYLWIGHFGQDPLSYFRAPAGAKRGPADVITFFTGNEMDQENITSVRWDFLVDMKLGY